VDRHALRVPAREQALRLAEDHQGAIHVLQSQGRRVPDDVAIVGFDDIPAAAGALIPLTTIRVDLEALGRTGVDLLIGSDRTQRHITLPVDLVVRTSCGADQAT